MQAQEIMTSQPACCTPQTGLRDVARMMVEHDCGAIPVVQSDQDRHLVGMITDRDIVCRSVAEGKNPLGLTAADCMSDTIVAVTTVTDLEDCCRIMEEHQIRRIPVVDDAGQCCGMVAQADVAQRVPGGQAARFVKELSRQTEGAAAL